MATSNCISASCFANVIRTFLFDGRLPTRKCAEREARYDSSHLDYIQQSSGGPGKYLPAPFVVLVCQQTLVRLSRSQELVVRVVPGEADDFCVHLAREAETAFIISTDGDFLVYMAEKGNFVPLQTFPLQWDRTITLPVFTKSRMRLGITKPNGLIEVAALLKGVSSLSVEECIACVNRNQTLKHISRQTLHQYVEIYLATEEFSPTTEIQEILDCGVLSGRLTELFFTDTIPTFWLPLLPVMNPPRKTPWEISRSIRQFAYYELKNRGFISRDVVVEKVQRGQHVTGEEVPIGEISPAYILDDREAVFITAMKILADSVSRTEMRLLPCFVGMYILFQQPPPLLLSAYVSPAEKYLILQYQTIIYSLLILLQAQSPTSGAIPEFATLWDLPRFKTAVSTEVKGTKDFWQKIYPQHYPIESLSKSTFTQSRPRNEPVKERDSKPATQTYYDEGNRFSRLAND